MKKVVFLLFGMLMVSSFSFAQENIYFRFANPQITQGDPSVLSFDIELRVDNPQIFHRDLQIYIDYNTLAFGENIVATGNLDITHLELMDNFYETVNVVDNTTAKFAVVTKATDELTLNGSSQYFNEVPTTYTGLINVHMDISAENNIAGISFDEDLMNGGQFFQSLVSTEPLAFESPCNYENNMENIYLTPHDLNLLSGWSGISSYMIPFNSNIEDVLDPLGENLVLVKNLTGVYYPEEDLNTLGDWDNLSGYIIKISADSELNFTGSKSEDPDIELQAGWNLMPVPSSCGVNTEDLFSDIISEVIVVKDIAGVSVFWPDLQINTLPFLMPGKAYFIKLNSSQTITFPVCE